MIEVRFRRRMPEKGAHAVLAGPDAAPALRLAGFTGAADEAASHHDASGRRVIAAGLGTAPSPRTVREAAGRAAARAHGETRLAIDARTLPAALAAEAAVGAMLRAWRYSRAPVPATDEPPPPLLERIDIAVADKRQAGAVWDMLRPGVAGALLARELVTEPANRLTPHRFAARLRELETHGLAVEVLGRKALREAGFGALLGVAQGSAEPPCVVVLRWKGKFEAPPVALIGKGITFDTGGVDIKPANRMWDMRADMAGAAACAGAMLALALRRSPAPAVAVLGLAENMLGAEAQRPSDIVRTVDGTTVEVIDTDAEGRLVLADCLAWTAKRFRPRAMIDLATLTGSIVVALGHHRAGLFATDAALAAQIAAAGEAVDEHVWPMPLTEGYKDELKSDIADLRNCSPRRMQPDACHAAAFLRHFAHDTPWAHLDIAGVEAREEDEPLGPKGATGFGARLLDKLVSLRFEMPEE
ncbi:leucyl aminopeptidase [Elioraea rosea]|uniref:leucyl aminopeptidase n=1 Tax=Elioraea rosea TaxID=2492390 RepID=UPI00118467CD|nr:leucyl aminopeptidase [Elioraea rosea]